MERTKLEGNNDGENRDGGNKYGGNKDGWNTNASSRRQQLCNNAQCRQSISSVKNQNYLRKLFYNEHKIDYGDIETKPTLTRIVIDKSREIRLTVHPKTYAEDNKMDQKTNA